jgi:hypothetical protein
MAERSELLAGPDPLDLGPLLEPARLAHQAQAPAPGADRDDRPLGLTEGAPNHRGSIVPTAPVELPGRCPSKPRPLRPRAPCGAAGTLVPLPRRAECLNRGETQLSSARCSLPSADRAILSTPKVQGSIG